MEMLRRALAIVVLGSTAFATSADAHSAEASPLVLAVPPRELAPADWEELARAAGSRIVIVHGDDVFLLEASDAAVATLEASGVATYARPLSSQEMRDLSDAGRVGALAWNRRLEAGDSDGPVVIPPQLPGQSDALTPPPAESGKAGVDGAESAGAPSGAGFYDTSEFLMGRVAVGVVLPESDGSIQMNREDWTTQEITDVVAGIQGALAYWATRDARAQLSFELVVFDSIATGYEPIRNGTWSSGQQELWITECMDSLGFSTGNIFFRTRAFDNALRDSLDCDWGITMFVVDSSEDPDGRFSDGTYAYSYIGGPFLVMTYDNWTWGIGNMDAIASHELAHQFYALDEYVGTCTDASGYLGTQNQNVDNASCALDVLCLMRVEIAPAFEADSICWYTRGQIGWRDTDADSIFDILDTEPQTVLDAFPDTSSTPTPTFTGVATLPFLTNLNPRGLGNEITLAYISEVECRVDGGPWSVAAPVDGEWDGVSEAFTFTTGVLSEEPHTFEARARSSAGNVDATAASDVFDVLDVTPPAAVTSFAASALDTTVTLTWTTPATSDFEKVVIRYRTDAVPMGPLDGTLLNEFPSEPATAETTIHFGVIPDTTYFYAAFALDEVPNASVAASATALPLEPPPPAVVYAPAPGELYVPELPAFLWTPAVSVEPDTIVAYWLQVARTIDFASAVIDSEVVAGAPADTAWTALASLEEGALYYARLRAKDASSGTYGYYSQPTSFTTALPVDSVEWRSEIESVWTNFADGETLGTDVDARIEAAVRPADSLGYGGHAARVVFTTDAGATWDSLALAWDHASGDTGFFRGTLELGVDFQRHERVEFRVEAWDPTTAATPRIDDGGYDFVAGARSLAAFHTPAAIGAGPGTMRDPFVGNYLDTLYTFEVGAPAGEVAGAELRLRHASGGAYTAHATTLAGIVNDIAYYRASLDTTFAMEDSLDYYFVTWGSAFDTTFVAGSDEAYVVLVDSLAAEIDPFRLLVGTVTAVTGTDAHGVATAWLGPNSPNPFNPVTSISFEVSGSARVAARLVVYDAAGRLVRVLVDEALAPGRHVATWRGLDDNDRPVPSGTYLYVLTTGTARESRRMTLLK
jgi:hypothetical protein